MKTMKTMFKSVLVALLCLASINTVEAKGADYYQSKGRIALSSDGNKHDNDDMHATKMTLMILAKAGLQNVTTLYTYADHVWGSEDNDLAVMKQSAEVTGQKFGFNACNFIAAVERPDDAYQAMAKEIAKSTAEDPLFIIAAGPMHVVGTGFELAEDINPDALNYVTVVTHSKWNNEHADKYETKEFPHGIEEPHSGWTWDEMVKAFGSKVNYLWISDQNGTPDANGNCYKSKDKFAAPSWDTWNFMRDHKDPNVNWVYNHDGMPGGPDYSDAGIAYYLVADLDGVRGDQEGNPGKLERWLGDDIIPVVVDETKVWSLSVNPSRVTLDEVGDTEQLGITINPSTAVDKTFTCVSSNENVVTVSNTGLVTATGKGSATVTVTTTDGGKIANASITVGTVDAGEVTVGYDFIAFEAESSKSPLGSNWVLRTPEDPKYGQIGGSLGAINDTYIEATQGNAAGTATTAGADMLQYKFTPKSDGVYQLTARMAQQLKNDDGTVNEWDKCNDIYVKMEGDFTSGNEVDLGSLQRWVKCYGRGKQTWGTLVKIEPSHGKLYPAEYKLKAGVEYTFSISARSKGMCIDYFLFSRAAIKVAESQDLAMVNEERLRPGGDTTYVDETIPALSFTRLPAAGEFVEAKADANKNALQIQDPLKWAAVETTYAGQEGDVFVSIETLLESDGESTFIVFINGEELGRVTNPKIYGTSVKDYTASSTVLNTTKFPIKKGDKIRVEFNSATNGLVPEGNSTATSRGRWRNLKFHTSSLPADDYSDAIAPEIMEYNVPTVVPVNMKTTEIGIKYTTGKPVDFEITIHDITDSKNWITKGFSTTHIPLEIGIELEKKFNINTVALPISEGKTYRWVMYFTNSGGTWQDGYPAKHVTFTASKDAAGILEVESSFVVPTVFSDIYHVSSDKAVSNIQFVSLSGSVVLDAAVNSQEATIATSSLQDGLYIAVIKFEDGKVATAKALKK